MSDDPALVDTNVLVYALYEQSEQHAAASGLLDRAQSEQLSLCITPQVVAELYAVITDPRRVTNPYRPEEALGIVERVLAMPGMALLPIPIDVVTRWVALARRHPVTRGAIFDVQLVATMLANDVRSVYTFDSTHFERFEEIEVLTP